MCLRGLRNVDNATIRVFLRLLNPSGKIRYTWDSKLCDGESSHPPDAVILPYPLEGSPAPPPVQTPVIVLIHPGSPLPTWPHHALTRPLQLEDFTEVLLDIESLIARAPHKPLLEEYPSLDFQDARLRFKVTTWPSSAVLTQHPHFSRLTAFLRSRFLGIDELIKLSRSEEKTVTLLLRTLHDLRLLSVQRLDITVTVSPVMLTPPQESPANRVLGIIDRLRRKMGLRES